MKIGVPKEIKAHEYRVGMTPGSVAELVALGHEVLVQATAGAGISVSDQAYIDAGAKLAATADEIYAAAELIIKVKEPQPDECNKLHAGQVIFCFLHLAADHAQAQALRRSGVTAIAYETVTDQAGRLPLLAPMSAIAGRISIQSGAHHLEKPQGGKGILLGAVDGVQSANVTIIGAGVVGFNALQIALGMGAVVTVLDKSAERLKEIAAKPIANLKTIVATPSSIADSVLAADLVIGAVLVPGAEAPKVVTKDVIAAMQPGSVVVDVAIDQGGCFETSRATNFLAPTYVESGVIHHCVTNLPGAVPRTSTFALNNATLPFIIELANKGYKTACLENQNLLHGLNICKGMVTHEAVAKATNHTYVPALNALKD